MWPKSNCKGCEKREVGCHAKCSDYLSFREQLDKIKEEKYDWYASNYISGWSGKYAKYHSGYIPTKKLIDRRTD